MTGKELKAWRERLNIPLQFIGSAFGLSYATISLLENGHMRKDGKYYHRLRLYKRLLEQCENKKIYYPVRVKEIRGITKKHTRPSERVPLEDVQGLKVIIRSLGMRYKDIEISKGIKKGRLSKCFLGVQYLTKSEYAAIKEYIKQKKLEKIFGGKKS